MTSLQRERGDVAWPHLEYYERPSFSLVLHNFLKAMRVTSWSNLNLTLLALATAKTNSVTFHGFELCYD